MSGSLAFGNVIVGKSASLPLTITNSGTGALTVSRLTITSGLETVYFTTFTGGTIPPGGTQITTITFTPAAATTYNGTLSVNGDHTSGTNTMAISGTGMAASSATYTTR